jgi:hypothetical protein
LGPSDASVVTTAGSELSAHIGHLDRWTEYKVWVQAFTQVGDGPRSELLLVRTDEDGKDSCLSVGCGILSAVTLPPALYISNAPLK